MNKFLPNIVDVKLESGVNSSENEAKANKKIARLFISGLSFQDRNSQLSTIAEETGITKSRAFELHTMMGNLSTWHSYEEA
ncbi:MAG: hypothetical protein ABIM99_04590 [Candidatus Dojkabacteria bacterium]